MLGNLKLMMVGLSPRSAKFLTESIEEIDSVGVAWSCTSGAEAEQRAVHGPWHLVVVGEATPADAGGKLLPHPSLTDRCAGAITTAESLRRRARQQPAMAGVLALIAWATDEPSRQHLQAGRIGSSPAFDEVFVGTELIQGLAGLLVRHGILSPPPIVAAPALIVTDGLFETEDADTAPR